MSPPNIKRVGLEETLVYPKMPKTAMIKVADSVFCIRVRMGDMGCSIVNAYQGKPELIAFLSAHWAIKLVTWGIIIIVFS